jgi:hypothetical protein
MQADDPLIALKQRIDALETALRALVDDADHVTPESGYTMRECVYCGFYWFDDAPEEHADDCPLTAARAALGEGEK